MAFTFPITEHATHNETSEYNKVSVKHPEALFSLLAVDRHTNRTDAFCFKRLLHFCCFATQVHSWCLKDACVHICTAILITLCFPIPPMPPDLITLLKLCTGEGLGQAPI